VHTDRCRCPAEVWLAYEVVVDATALELRRHVEELALGLDGEDDDPDGCFWWGCWLEGFAGGVGELGCDGPEREVCSDYQVVVGATLMSPVILGGGLAVKLGSWRED
jgi:hypothetical protein